MMQAQLERWVNAVADAVAVDRQNVARNREKRPKRGGRMGAAKTSLKQSFSLEKPKKTKGKMREAPAGFEPAIADLQSAALATWRRRQPKGRT